MSAWWGALLALAVSIGVVQSDARDRVAAEFERLSRDLVTSVAESDRAGLASRLERGRSALSEGALYLALYDLQPVFEGEAGYRLTNDKSIAALDDFKRKWTALGAPADPPSTRAPVLFVEALAQSAEGRAPATYRASLPYAGDAGLAAGLYYLGESHAMVRFAAFARGLPLTASAPRPQFAPLDPALTAYERDVVKAYDTAAAPVRPRYAGVSVAIKQARTLDEAGRQEGALLQYLVSRFRYGLIRVEGATHPPAADINRRLDATTLPAGADHSIGDFFLQLARATLKGQQPAPESAVVILDDILPAYLELVKR